MRILPAFREKSPRYVTQKKIPSAFGENARFLITQRASTFIREYMNKR